MSGHTPGPWEVGRAMRNDQECIVGDVDSVVAFMPDETIGCTFIPANARLIAAAPELLAALIDLADRAEGLESKCLGTVMARAAIAKATGATP